MFLVQASAMGEFWHNRRDLVMFAYPLLAAGIAAPLQLPLADRVLGTSLAFASRLALDVTTVVGQSALASADKRGRIDWSAFGENAGYSALAMLGGRAVAGFGYRPYNLTAKDVDVRVAAHLASGSDDWLVFKTRQKAGLGNLVPAGAEGSVLNKVVRSARTKWASPLSELTNTSISIDGVLIVKNNKSWFTYSVVGPGGQDELYTVSAITTSLHSFEKNKPQFSYYGTTGTANVSRVISGFDQFASPSSKGMYQTTQKGIHRGHANDMLKLLFPP
jgi:hypothetical protein